MSILQDLLALNKPASTTIEESDDDFGQGAAQNAAEELEDLHNQITKLMSEARSVVRSLPRHMKGSAEAYWIPHIMIALGGEHEWMTAGHESTMQKTIDELKEYASEGDGQDDEGDGDDSMGRRNE